MSDNEYKDYQPKKAIVNKPLAWTDLALSEQVKTLRFFRDKDNNIMAMPVVFFDPTQPGLNVLPLGRVGISDPAALSAYARVFGHPCVGWPEATMGLITHSTQMVQNCLQLEAVRTPTIFRSNECHTAAATAVWAPAAGTRFRLMGGVISFAGPTLAAAAASQINFLDQAAAISLYFRAWIPTTAIHMPHIAFDLRPNGYLSAVADNVLNVTLTANYATGGLGVTVWGTEE